MELQFIDCGCTVGIPAIPVKRISYDKESVKKTLKGLNVKKAYCMHNLAVKNGDFRENRLLKEEFEGDDFFLPSYTFLMNNELSENAAEEFGKILKEDGIRVMNMNPALHGINLSEFFCGEYFEILDSLKMTVTMPFSAGALPGFTEIASKYKNVNFILFPQGFSRNPDLFMLMKKLDNVYSDCSPSPGFEIEKLVERFGSERLVFASHAPEFAASTFVGRIILSTLTDSEKENIAHKNIERLTGVKLI